MEPNNTQASIIKRYNGSIIAAQAVVFLFAIILSIAAVKDSLVNTQRCETPVVITIVTAMLYLLFAITCLRRPAVSLLVATVTTALFIPSALIVLFTTPPGESKMGVLLFLAIAVSAVIILTNGTVAAHKLSEAKPRQL